MTRAKRQAHRFGIYAETAAAFYLRLKGYRIIALRHRNPKGEIDLLAVKGNVLAVVEVKARKDISQGAASITPYKQMKIIGAVEWLMAGQSRIAGLARGRGRDIRFDVVLIAPWRWPKHMKDAWRT